MNRKVKVLSHVNNDTVQPNDQLDILKGARSISFFLGPDWSPRQVFAMAGAKQLPCFKIGGRLCARKSTLLSRIEEQERGS